MKEIKKNFSELRYAFSKLKIGLEEVFIALKT